MKVAFACDHAGFPLREPVLQAIREGGHVIVDLGTHSTDPVDYPDFAEKIGRAIQRGEVERGVILCGSGVGAAIAANKLRGVRAGLCHDTYSAHQCVEHDDANVLSLGARIVGSDLAMEIVHAFLRARFTGEERHVRRVGKINALEKSG